MSNNREVTDEKITRLSKLLPDGKYSELFGCLGFNYNHTQKILKKKSMDSTAASKELLQEWKDKGGSTKDLDAALRKADLGGLVTEVVMARRVHDACSVSIVETNRNLNFNPVPNTMPNPYPKPF